MCAGNKGKPTSKCRNPCRYGSTEVHACSRAYCLRKQGLESGERVGMRSCMSEYTAGGRIMIDIIVDYAGLSLTILICSHLPSPERKLPVPSPHLTQGQHGRSERPLPAPSLLIRPTLIRSPHQNRPFPSTSTQFAHNMIKGNTADVELTEEELILTPTVAYGFSLSYIVWCTFLPLPLRAVPDPHVCTFRETQK